MAYTIPEPPRNASNAGRCGLVGKGLSTIDSLPTISTLDTLPPSDLTGFGPSFEFDDLLEDSDSDGDDVNSDVEGSLIGAPASTVTSLLRPWMICKMRNSEPSDQQYAIIAMRDVISSTKKLPSCRLILLDDLPVVDNFWINSVCRSYGIFFFMGHGAYGGCFAILVLLLSNWWMAVCSLVCVTSANLFAVFVLRSSSDRINDGSVGQTAVPLGLCIAVLQPAEAILIFPCIALACFCMWLQDLMGRAFQPLGLSTQVFPAMICIMMWRDGLSDALKIFPPVGVSPPSHAPVDMFGVLSVVVTGVTNMAFLPPSYSAVALLSVGWLCSNSSVLIAIWCGSGLGVIADYIVGAPIPHFWTGMTGLNSSVAFAMVYTVLFKPAVWTFLFAAAASLCAGIIASYCAILGLRGMCWPCGFVILIIEVVRNRHVIMQSAASEKVKELPIITQAVAGLVKMSYGIKETVRIEAMKGVGVLLVAAARMTHDLRHGLCYGLHQCHHRCHHRRHLNRRQSKQTTQAHVVVLVDPFRIFTIL